jgi:protein-S-isoprenylcysteine O-methyltransferase Ste14
VPSLAPRLAGVLFRLRSFTPLPLIVAVVLTTWRDHIQPGPGGAAVDAALDVVGLALAGLGSLVRVLTVGFEPGTNSQTRVLGAPSLSTSGPYAAMRHPLYLGNALIVTGLLCIVDEPLAWALVGLAFAGSTLLIARAEEALLARRFGAAWTRWAEAVPPVSLNPARWRALQGLPFDWRTAVRRETNPVVAWGLLAQASLAWEWWARATLTDTRARGLELGMGGLLALLLLNKLWKLAQPHGAPAEAPGVGSSSPVDHP